MTTTACASCLVAGAIKTHQGRCFREMHAPHGDSGTRPLHPGKTARDRASGALARRIPNRMADPGRAPHKGAKS